MADEVVLASTGYVYIAPVGTAMPTLPINDPKVPGAPWVSVGNTSLENGITRAVDGDDPEVKGSWQNAALITTKPVQTRTISINLEDFVVESYELYYGAGQIMNETGAAPYVEGTSLAKTFRIAANPAPVEKALLIIAVSGGYQVVEHYEKVSFLGSDDFESDAEELSELPVTGTCLSNTGDTHTGLISERIAFGS
jgi:hypothetical protein